MEAKGKHGVEERTVGPGGSAAVGVVTKGVDVHATLGVGVAAGDVPGDLGGLVLGVLLKGDGAGNLGVTTDDADWIVDVSVPSYLCSLCGCVRGPGAAGIAIRHAG